MLRSNSLYLLKKNVLFFLQSFPHFPIFSCKNYLLFFSLYCYLGQEVWLDSGLIWGEGMGIILHRGNVYCQGHKTEIFLWQQPVMVSAFFFLAWKWYFSYCIPPSLNTSVKKNFLPTIWLLEKQNKLILFICLF